MTLTNTNHHALHVHPILNANLTHAAPSSPDQRMVEAQERSRRKLVSVGQYRTTCTFLERTVATGQGTTS